MRMALLACIKWLQEQQKTARWCRSSVGPVLIRLLDWVRGLRSDCWASGLQMVSDSQFLAPVLSLLFAASYQLLAYAMCETWLHVVRDTRQSLLMTLSVYM